MQKVLITGITGFVGSHLAEYLLTKPDIVVYGTIRWRSRKENIAEIADKINLVDCDLKDAHSVDKVISEIKPDKIFHLAAQSYVPASWQQPAETFQTNVIGQINLLEAVRKHCKDCVVQIAGSSEEYGLVYPTETPIRETNDLRPISPYGVSKVAQDYSAYQYFKSYGLNIIRTRAFNHTGPRRGDVFVESNFAKQIAEIEIGKKEYLEYGNLEAIRDYTDVRDIVKGYYLITEKGIAGEVYNLSSGKGYTIREILTKLKDMSMLQTILSTEDKSRLRPSDVEILIGDHSKITKQTSWNPEIDITTTLKDLLTYWRAKV